MQEAIFCQAFRHVWSRIPLPDRECLTAYWCEERPRWNMDRWYRLEAPCPCPRIEIVSPLELQRSDTVCRFPGCELFICASMLRESREDLQRGIARLLAQVARIVNEQHWALFMETVEHPYQQWQDGLKKPACESRHDQKWNTLMKRYVARYESELDEIVSVWGFDEPAVGTSNG
jgi:hypothetical protein